MDHPSCQRGLTLDISQLTEQRRSICHLAQLVQSLSEP
jgi:hypothetical protein